MATQTYKTLAQTNPSATTLTTHYTVPGATSTTVSTIVVCNRSATPTTYRISIAPAAAADDNKQYIAYDAPIAANESITYTLGITLATTDLIRVYATLATLSFNSFGVEIS